MIDMSGHDCGGVTNNFKYVDGPALDAAEVYGADMSQFDFSEEFQGEYLVSGQVTDRLWIGTHSFQVQSRNGVFDSESVRGEQGLFGSVTSETITVTVVDPCEQAIVNSDESMVFEDLIAPDGVETYQS